MIKNVKLFVICYDNVILYRFDILLFSILILSIMVIIFNDYYGI